MIIYTNTMQPRQKGRHFSDDIFNVISLARLISITIDSDNALAPTRRQAVIWINYGKFVESYMRQSAWLS